MSLMSGQAASLPLTSAMRYFPAEFGLTVEGRPGPESPSQEPT